MNLIGWKPNNGLYPQEETGCGWTESEKVRLFPNHAALRFQYPVHELVEPSLKHLGVSVERCPIPVHHYGKLAPKTATAKIMPYYRLGKKKLLELEGDAGAIRELAIQTAVVGDHRAAVDLWKRFIKLQPNHCDGYVHIGASYTQLGQFEAALSASEKALALDPVRQEARYNYGISQLYLGNAPKAVEALEHILLQHPDYLPGAFMLAAAYCCNGMRAEGVLWLKRLKKTAMGSELSFRCLDLARCLILRQLLDYALWLLDAAIESRVVSEETRSLQLNIVQLKKTASAEHSV
jgi:tetratricopeptide (TPR) repeat protein